MLQTFPVTELLLQHKICKIDVICFTKSVMTEDLYILQKEAFSVTWYKCDK
jgi:hypothetical protein